MAGMERRRFVREIGRLGVLLGSGYLLAGCGGGGGGSDDSQPPGTVSASGRFVLRDVTPTVNTPPAGDVPVGAIGFASASPGGLVGGTVSRRVGDGTNPFAGTSPAVIDINRRTVTLIRYSGPDTPVPLENGFVSAISSRGDAYGYFQESATARGYNFIYRHATGKTTISPRDPLLNTYIFTTRATVSDDGEVILRRNGSDVVAGSSGVARYDALGTSERPIVSPLPGYAAYGDYVNDDGRVAGMLYNRSTAGPDPLLRAFTWKDGVGVALPLLPESVGSRADGIDNDGLIVGTSYFSDGTRRITTWKNETATALPAPPVKVDFLGVLGTNADGDILAIVTTTGPNPSSNADDTATYLLWRNRSRVWLDLTPEAKEPNTPVTPVALLEDGRLLCTSSFRLYTLTVR